MLFSRPLYDLRLGVFKRRDYYDLINTTRIFTIIRNSKIVGIYAYRSGLNERNFKSFTIKFDQLFPGSKLIFIFFPIAH